MRERYEVHHGVRYVPSHHSCRSQSHPPPRIADNALVAAAELAHRYITERFLPDTAIDLVDEACSRLRLQQESKPEQLENLDRAIMTIQIELESLVGLSPRNIPWCSVPHSLFPPEKRNRPPLPRPPQHPPIRPRLQTHRIRPPQQNLARRTGTTRKHQENQSGTGICQN